QAIGDVSRNPSGLSLGGRCLCCRLRLGGLRLGGCRLGGCRRAARPLLRLFAKAAPPRVERYERSRHGRPLVLPRRRGGCARAAQLHRDLRDRAVAAGSRLHHGRDRQGPLPQRVLCGRVGVRGPNDQGSRLFGRLQGLPHLVRHGQADRRQVLRARLQSGSPPAHARVRRGQDPLHRLHRLLGRRDGQGDTHLRREARLLPGCKDAARHEDDVDLGGGRRGHRPPGGRGDRRVRLPRRGGGRRGDVKVLADA
ncbi:hypothetical protein EMIHUDRAFT_443887, partial [Emiliania huxleyi CCMP1516]|uniref:Uncharacterized protein n=2 Tax=Emiliania huxleyi TaxID=2903 RepID=A0A0D3JLI7_EMIH1